MAEDNIPPHVQVPVHMLQTPAQTGLMVKGSHGRPPGSLDETGVLEGQTVSVNAIRENEIEAENPSTEATTTTSSRQSCQPDIHSVLREMSAVLAELKVEQRHTTAAVNNLETRLRASESQLEELKKKSEERKVAFSASLSGSGHTGPYSIDIILVYKDVFTNIGNAYNPTTGIFTAPVRGVYQFRFSAHGGSGRHVTVVLQKNGDHIAGTHAFQPGGNVSTSNGVSLLLEVGDVVCLKLRANTWVWDDWFHHTTFSGEMLFSV
ncbi:uncharacterized protein [Salminus brasiliensis]|uniref:uncharacterized protein n=1 Tax=Salminus brasiliensis TaxID=930266 RepID=UPI003B82E5BF